MLASACCALQRAPHGRVHARARDEALQAGGDLRPRVLLAADVPDDVRHAEGERRQDEQQPLKLEAQEGTHLWVRLQGDEHRQQR